MSRLHTKHIILIFLILIGCVAIFFSSGFQQVFIEDDLPHNNNTKNTPIRISEKNGVRTYYPTITSYPEDVATQTPISHELQQPILPKPTQITQTPTATAQPLQENMPDASQNPFTIGDTVEGRGLEMYKFGNGESSRLIVAGIHGGYEYNTTDLALALIQAIEENPELIPDTVTLYVLPSLNPDGLARSHGYSGRANANNVDLNRNWELHWSSTWNPDGCWHYLPISGGTAALSEPEVIALDQFINQHQPDAVISYHSAALGIFAGGSPELTLSDSLAEAIAAVAPYSYPPVQTNCEMTGQFIDSLAYRGIPAVDIELSNHKDIELEENLKILTVFLNWEP